MARLKLKRIIPDTGSNIDYDTGLSAANKLNENSEAIESFSEGLMPSDLVHRSGNEVIAGVKTFTSSPKAPEPVNQNDLATKRYVDNHSGGTGGDTVDMFKKGVTTIDNSYFFPPDEVQYPLYITPGSYGVSFVDPPIAEISNENNFTLVVEYASSDGSGADGDQDYTHTLVSQSGRRFTRTIKHVQDGISVSEFEEVYGTKAFIEENYVKKTVVEKITEYYRIEEDDDWFDIDANTKENVNIELAWNGTLAFDSPLGDDKSVLIQLKSLDLTQDYKVKLQVDGDILLDESNNEVELGDGVTIFAIYSSVQDKWTVTWSTTQEEPAVEDYSDVAVKQMLTSGGQLVAPGNNKRLFFTGTSGLNVGDLFFYNYGSHYFTGLYRVFNSGGTIVYADRIAERTTLRTVRVAGDGVYHNQFDGTNASTVLFTKKDSLSDFNQDSTHRTVTDSQVNTWNGKQNALGYTPEQAGVAQSLIDSLKGGVSEEGDTLYKLYALIVSSFSEINVQDTAQRNAYNVTKLPTNIFVLNDGDSKWALYKCVSTGTDRVDDVKISDPDLLNAVMTASQIKTAYESNENTNAFTDSEKEKVGNTSGVNSGDETKSTIYNKLGITQYGGIISANLDTINENNKYTAYGTATGVPSSSYSWFIDHQNSNVGTASATQRAIAYSTTLIIYERVKQGGTWGSWIKQNVLSDAFISTWNSKQSQLVSGENIKTINGNSVLGSGNIELVIPSQLNSEQSARIAGDATLDEKINQVSSGYLGFISNSDAAPTPGKNGFYEFTDDSETGPMWLDVGPIYAADKVSVVYDSINLTYTYQLIQANVNYVSKGSAETITGEKTFSVSPKVPEPVEDEDAINRKFFEENRNGLFVLLPDKCVRRLTNGSISFVSGENIVAFNNEGQYISVKPLSMTIGADSILVLSANESTYTKIDYKNITDYSELYFFCINVTNWNILDTINKNDVLFISVGGEIEFSKQSQFSTVEDINKLAVLSNITYYDSGSKYVLNIPDETFVLASSGRYAFFDEQQILVETNKAILISTTPVDYTPASKTKLKDISKLYLIIKDIADWIIFSNIDFEDILFINNNVGVFYSKINNLQKVNSKWAGKKIGFLGDSITDGTYDPASAKIERFVDKYASMTMCEAVNYGIGGTTLAEWLDGDVEGYEAMCHRYVDMANDLDVIVVEGGTNDHRGDYSTNRALPLGSFNGINIDGTLDKTFYGGLHTLMRGLKNKYPNKPIVFVTPNHYNYTGGGRINDSDTNITLLNSNGIIEEFYKPGGAPLSMYVEAIKKCASFYGLNVLNTYEALWNPAIPGDSAQYTIDGIHPNSIGCEKMANVLYNFIEKL